MGRCVHRGVVGFFGCDDGYDVFAGYVSPQKTTTAKLAVRPSVRAEKTTDLGGGYAVKWGMGRPISTLSLHDSIESQKPFYVSIWMYNLAMGCTKYSLLLQYLRIFPQKPFRKAVFVMLGVNTVYVLWTTGSAVFACWPISYFWTQVEDPDGGGACLERFTVW